MAVDPSAPSQSIKAHIQGDISGQVAVGTYIWQNSVHGGVVNINVLQPGPRWRERPTPVMRLPHRAFPDLLDREMEVDAAQTALQSRQPMEFYGEAGLGKTTLLRHLAHHLSNTAYPDGVAYLPLQGRPLGDLFHYLFDVFYECDVTYKAIDVEARGALQKRNALILLDDLELGRDEVQVLLDVMPDCTFLLASEQRHLWGEGCAVALTGLPPDQALTLVERELGRPLTRKERPAAKSLCSSLRGHPLCIRQAVALAQKEGRSLAEVARKVKAPSPAVALTSQIVQSLTEPQLRILAPLAVLDSAPVSAEHLGALTGFSNLTPMLEALQQDGLVQAYGPGYSLAGTLAANLGQMWDLTPWAERALAYFTAWTEAQRQAPEHLMEDIQPILEIMEWGARSGHWKEVLRIGKVIDSALAVSGQWEKWGKVLGLTLRAARSLQNQAVEAWALHQLGSRALCKRDLASAHTLLEEALHLREMLGDEAGAAVTRDNLSLLPALPPPPQEPPRPTKPLPPSRPAGSSGPFRKLVGVLTTLAIVGGSAVIWALRPTQTPTPQTVVSSVSTSMPLSTYMVMPTGTSTPQLMPTLTETASATPTSTPTSTPAPPALSPEPALGPISFATGVTDDNQPVGANTTFPNDVEEIHTIFSYEGMSESDTWERHWYQDGEEVGSGSGPWDAGENGTFDLSLTGGGEPLGAGTWKLEIYVNGELAQTGTFVIQASATPTAQAGPGSPAVGGKYQIAFARWDGGKHNLYIANTDGSGERLLLEAAAGPSWSPSGQYLSIFGEQGITTQVRDAVPYYREDLTDGILVVKVANFPSDITQVEIEQKVRDGTARWTAWAPNGEMLAFDATRGSPDRRIYFLGTADNQQYNIEIPGEQADWSPNSNQIVYRSSRDGKQGIWISNRDGSGAHNITNEGSDSLPSWSPDGRKIAFHRDSGGNVDIYVMDVDGNNVRRLTDAPGPDTLPAWTPDGRIVFRSARTGNWGIYIMNADSSGQLQIIANTDPGPDWTFGKMDVY